MQDGDEYILILPSPTAWADSFLIFGFMAETGPDSCAAPGRSICRWPSGVLALLRVARTLALFLVFLAMGPRCESPGGSMALMPAQSVAFRPGYDGSSP